MDLLLQKVVLLPITPFVDIRRTLGRGKHIQIHKIPDLSFGLA
jgi:hypothetical protein